MDKTIYYHDTDCGGVVYYANYLKYFEEERTEYLKSKGITLNLLSDDGFLLVVRKVEIRYRFPAHYGDRITVETRRIEVKGASIVFYQDISKDTKLLVEATTVLASVDSRMKPRVLTGTIQSFLQP